MQDEVAAAEPSIDEKTAQLVSKGRWSVPGYKVRPYSTCRHLIHDANSTFRRNSATFPYYRQRASRDQNYYTLSLVYSSIVDKKAGKR